MLYVEMSYPSHWLLKTGWHRIVWPLSPHPTAAPLSSEIQVLRLHTWATEPDFWGCSSQEPVFQRTPFPQAVRCWSLPVMPWQIGEVPLSPYDALEKQQVFLYRPIHICTACERVIMQFASAVRYVAFPLCFYSIIVVWNSISTKKKNNCFPSLNVVCIVVPFTPRCEFFKNFF